MTRPRTTRSRVRCGVHVSGSIVVAVLLTTCLPQIHPPYDLSDAGFAVTQTFGQLIGRGGSFRPAEYVVVKTPPGTVIRTPVTGVVSYMADFQGLGPSLIVTPKTYLNSDTDFDQLEGLPNPAGVRLVYANLIESEVKDRIEQRYTVLNVTAPDDAADRFIARHPDNRDVEVETGATLADNTELAVAQDDSLYIAAFLGDPNGITEWVNPLPYLAAGIPLASLPSLDNAAPEFKRIALLADQDPALVAPMIYEVPEGAPGIDPPNILFGHVAVEVEVEDRVRPGGENIGIYELAYEMNRVTRDGTNAIVGRALVASGRHLANRIDASDPPQYADLYNSVRSSADGRTFWYRLHFDPGVLTPDPAVRNYTSTTNPHSLDVSTFAAGEYELRLKVRDVLTDRATPVTRTVYAHIDNAPGAISSAQWTLRATAGPETAEVSRNDQMGLLVLPGGVPPPVQTVTLNAPAGTYCSSVKENNGAPVSGPYASPAPIALSQPGLHDIQVWLDENGDCVRDPSESGRRMVVMTYQLTVSITGERKHLGPSYGPPQVNTAPNPPIASSDGLRLTVAATGFLDAATAAAAVYRWEVAGPKGPETVAGDTWEKDPVTDGGKYVAKGIVELYGVRFESVWGQDVVGATVAPVAALCEGEERAVGIGLVPSPFPGALSVDYELTVPGAPATDGDAVFVASGTRVTSGNAASVDLRGVTASTAKDNVALVARFDGAEIAREPLSVCGIRFLDSTLVITDTLRIGRWDFAYSGGAFGLRNGAPPNHFIDRDPRNFTIRVIDHSKDLDPAVADGFNGALATFVGAAGGGAGALNDDFTTVRLTETGASTGIFQSHRQLLVSDDLVPAGTDRPDDDLAAHDGVGASPADDAPGDRTHRTTVRGHVGYRYNPEPGVTYADTLGVCLGASGQPQYRRTLFLRIEVFNEVPGADLNGDGAIGPAASMAQIRAELRRARSGWAQACIYVDTTGTNVGPAPSPGGVNIIADGSFNDGDVAGGTAEEVALVAAFGAASVDTAVVFFAGPLVTSTGGKARIPTWRAAGIGPPGMGQLTFLYVEPYLGGVNRTWRSLAHEIGHGLDNQFDAASNQTIFYPFMAPVIPPDNRYNQQRRITRITENNVRTVRAAAALGALGNRLLKVF